MAVPSATRF